MSSANTAIWDQLGRTDPKHTKPFTRGGGFKGTAIKPMFSYLRMTETFGPCGIGWGVGEPTFQVVPGSDGEVLVYCTASVWYCEGETMSRTVYGVGGDKVVNKFSSGLKSDDEAFKKAFTDAVTNALKLIGVGADVHMGMFDDNKYVNTMRQEFAEESPLPMRPGPPPPVDETYAPPPRRANGKPETGWREDGSRTSFWMKTNGTAEELRKQLQADAEDCHTILSLEKLKDFYRGKARELKFNASYNTVLREEFGYIEQRIMESLSNAELAEMPLKDTLQKSIRRPAEAEASAIDQRMRDERAALAQHPVNGG
jgi:hypothetical protein